MNANPVSSLAAIFVVLESTGQYSAHHSAPIKSFATREAAERFMSSKEATVRRLEGMQDAIYAMHNDWQKVNPAPGGYGSNPEEAAAWDAWHTINGAELERLETITGFRDAVKEAGLCPNDDVSYIGYYIKEVPFEG
jgi:hypothetical protein